MKKTIITRLPNKPITNNPFTVDCSSMGVQLSKELFLMCRNFRDAPLGGAYLYNIETGEAFGIKIIESVLKRCFHCEEWIDVLPVGNKQILTCKYCGTSNTFYTQKNIEDVNDK